MGLMICRFSNSDADGIYWLGDSTPPQDSYSLFDVMERYLTHGETMEILSYDPYDEGSTTAMLANERKAHKERNDT